MIKLQRYLPYSLLLIFEIGLGYIPAKAQGHFADTLYYLVDSLEHCNISKDDSLLIEQNIQAFHAAPADSVQLQIIESFIDNCYNNAIWPRYNKWLMHQSKILIDEAEKRNVNTDVYWYYYGVSYGNKGYWYDERGLTDQALHYYQIALEAFRRGGHKDGENKIIHAQATIYNTRGEMHRALETYNQALKLADSAKDTLGIIMVELSLSRIHMELLNIKEAKEARYRAKELAHLIGDKRTEGFALTSIAKLFYMENQYSQAEALAKEGLALLDEAGAVGDKINGLNILGNMALKKDEMEVAESYFNEMLHISQYEERPENTCMALIKLAQLNFQKNQPDKALTYGKRAYEITEMYDLMDQKGNATDILAKIYTQMEAYEKANRFLLEYTQLSDSTNTLALKKQALRQTIEYDYQKQKALNEANHQKELAIADAEKQRKNVLLWAIVIIAVLIGAGLVINYLRLKTIQKQKLALGEAYHQLELSKNDKILASNLKALQAQMNPHFIFNALNSIQTLVLRGDVDRSYDYINQFANLIRETLNSSELEYIPLEKEIESLKTYLQLEKLRFRDDFDYQLEIPDIVPNKNVPPMLIQPFVENALKHGLFHKETDRKLKIQLEVKDTLVCTIEDNGIGREAARKKQQNRNHKSYAIGSIKKRLEMMQEKLKMSIGVEYQDLKENNIGVGTRVIIKLPFQPQS